jgi:hypothetical protein
LVRIGPISGSLIAHAAVILPLARYLARDSPRVPDPPRGAHAPTPTAPPPEPIEVLLVRDSDEPDVRVAEIRTPDARTAESRTAEFRTSDSRTSDSRTSDSRTPDAGHRTPDTAGHPDAGRRTSLYMHMRGPSFALGDGELDAILDHPLPPPPQVERSGRLESAPGGAGVVHDAVTTVMVERDGTAHFRDKRDIDIHFHLPLPLPSLETLRHPERAIHKAGDELGKSLRAWYADPYKEMRKGPTTDLPDHLQAVPGQCDQWGALNCEPEPMPPPNTVASGKLDLTAYLMRKFHVGDPFEARKRALLDATRAERIDRGGRARAEALAHSAELARHNLEELWRTTPDAAARRAALFVMWDECAEAEGPSGEAGERARAEIMGWIRAHLPAGSPDAFTAAELADLAVHRASRQKFEPY